MVLDGVDIIIKKRGGYVSNYIQIYKIIKETKPDSILSNFSYVNPALLFGRLLDVKKNMVWFHSLNDQMASTKLNILIKRLFLKLADKVIANSALTKDELHSVYKVSSDHLTAIPFWSNISEREDKESILKMNSNSRLFNIGCPGRLVHHKNHKIVIEALSILKDSGYSDCHLHIAGEGEELENLKALSKELGVEEKVLFLGHLSPDDMLWLYKSVDVIVLPSLHEAFGLVFIEAISLGTSVLVSSQFGALSFISDGQEKRSRYSFNPESATELSEKILLLLNQDVTNKIDYKEIYQKNFNKEAIFQLLNYELKS